MTNQTNVDFDERGLRVAVTSPLTLLDGRASRSGNVLGELNESNFDAVVLGDHVGFRGGYGADALIQAAMLSGLGVQAPIMTACYQLALRHPVVVARQVSSLCQHRSNHFYFGVGLGGEDPSEFSSVGIRVSERGPRVNEALPIVRKLLAGETVTSVGRHFQLDRVRTLPEPRSRITYLVGGRSRAAARRAGRLADGWIGLWVTPEAFADCVATVRDSAARADRNGFVGSNWLDIWCGFGDSPSEGAGRLSYALRAVYGLPYDRLERYCAVGTPADVAKTLAEFAEAGCRNFVLAPVGQDELTSLRAVVETRSQLRELLVG